jgi:uncharacterized protein YukE
MGARKTKFPPKINDLVKKWASELNRAFQRKTSIWLKKHEEMLNILSRP